MKNTDTDALVMASDKTDIAFLYAKEPRQGGNFLNVKAKADIKDAEVGEEWYDFMQQLQEQSSSDLIEEALLKNAGDPSVGKQSIAFDLNYSGPDSFAAAGAGKLALNIPKATFKNDLMEMSVPVEITIERQGQQMLANVALYSSVKYNEAFDGYFEQSIANLIDAFYEDDDAAYSPSLMMFRNKVERESLKRHLGELLPNPSEWGETKVSLDFDFKGLLQGGANPTEGKLNLHTLELLVGDNGFSAEGNYDIIPEKGKMDIRCHRCKETFENVIGHVKRFEDMTALFGDQPIPEGQKLSTGPLVKLRQLVEALSRADTGEDRIIELVGLGPSDFTVTGHNKEEVQMMIFQMLMPYLMMRGPDGVSRPMQTPTQ